MNNQDMYNSARRYIVANAVIGSAASKMAELNREQTARIADAYEYLNSSLRNEMIHDCQNQKEFTKHLSQLLESRKDTYRPFYEKIGIEMPEDLETMTAERICSVMGVELMTPQQLEKYHRDKKSYERGEELAENVGLFFRAILIIGLLILIFLGM